MLDKKTRDELREKRKEGVTYPELHKAYGLPISTIEYHVSDIKPVRFTYFNRSSPKSGEEPIRPCSLSKKKVAKMEKNLDYAVKGIAHNSEDLAEIKWKLDEDLAANRNARPDRTCRCPPSGEEELREDASIAEAPAKANGFAKLSNNQRFLYATAMVAFSLNDYEKARRAISLYFLDPLLS